MRWHPRGEVLVSCSYDDAIKLWVEEDDEWVCAQTLAGACRRGAAAGRGGHGCRLRCLPGAAAAASSAQCFQLHLLLLLQGAGVATPAHSAPAPLRPPCAPPCPPGPGVGHTSTVWEVAFDAAGERMVSCSDDGSLKVWACRKDGGEQRWQLLATLSGYHPRTVFSCDWSPGGLVATGCADNAIRVFGEADGGAVAGDSTAADPALRALFLRPGAAAGALRLLGSKAQAHALDVNCVRWHPTDPTLLASASDDGCIKLWRWRPAGGE